MARRGRPRGSGITRYRHPFSRIYNRLRRASYRISWGQDSTYSTWKQHREEVPADYWEHMHRTYIKGVRDTLEAVNERTV